MRLLDTFGSAPTPSDQTTKQADLLQINTAQQQYYHHSPWTCRKRVRGTAAPFSDQPKRQLPCRNDRFVIWTNHVAARPNLHKRQGSAVIYDTPAIMQGYASVPLLDVTPLPRGGISIQTAAVGAVQFGIPPETIKDSMRLGLEVPRVFIVPVERFCREIGPALGINLAEFE